MLFPPNLKLKTTDCKLLSTPPPKKGRKGERERNKGILFSPS